jgi:hypothetical protein
MQVVIDVMSFVLGVGVGLIIWLIYDWFKLRKNLKKGGEKS